MNTLRKIFVSYSWDSDTHKDRILALADQLRKDGLDCHLDQYEVAPPQGWARWMRERIEQSDYVLVVCTETYQRRATGQEEAGKGLGVTWEGALTENEVYNQGAVNPKFIPVVFRLEDKSYIPTFLGTVSFYVLDSQAGYEKLYRRLTDQPEVIKEDVGTVMKMPPRKKPSLF